jgi:hypothetical protein
MLVRFVPYHGSCFAGCAPSAVRWIGITSPQYPVRVRTLTSELPTGIFALTHDTAIALCIQIVALTQLTIAQFHIEAPWLSQPVSWLKACA